MLNFIINHAEAISAYVGFSVVSIAFLWWRAEANGFINEEE